MDSYQDDLTPLVMDALEELKARDVTTLDVRNLTTVADTLVIASGTSSRHVKALADNLIERAKASGHAPVGVEGQQASDWVLVDLGDVVVHVMSPAAREFYDLERLWSMPGATAREQSAEDH